MFKKKDLIIYVGAFALIVISVSVWFLMHRDPGRNVRVSVDGEVLFGCSLDSPRTEVRSVKDDGTIEHRISLTGYNGGQLTMAISEGKAYMLESDCPDKICVKHRPISRAGECIICLPNRVLIEITGDDNEALDAVSQ